MHFREYKPNVKQYQWDAIDFPNKGEFFTALSVAPRNSGKTHSLLQLLDNLKDVGFYTKFYIVSPTIERDAKQVQFYNMLEQDGYKVQKYDDLNKENFNEIVMDLQDDIESWEEIKEIKKLFKEMLKKVEKYGKLNFRDLLGINELGFDNIEEMSDFIGELPLHLKNSHHPPASMLIIDDCFGSALLANAHSKFVQFYIKHRHYYCSIFTSLQSISNCPHVIRSNSTNFFIWPLPSNKCNKVLQDMMDRILNKSKFNEIMEQIGKTEYGFLYLDISNPKKPIAKIGFNGKNLL